MRTFKGIVSVLLLQIIFLEIALSALTEQGIRSTSNTIKNICKRSQKATDEEIAMLKQGHFPDSRTLHCYMSCALNMMKVMNKGKIDPVGAKKQLDMLMPDKFKIPMLEQLSKCQHLTSSDPCDLAKQFVNCCYKVNPAMPVIPT